MNESNVQPMKRSSIYATFGNYYGEKLYKLLYDCCQGVGSFCYEVLKCLGISDQGDSSKFLNQQGEWVTINTNDLLRVKVTVTSEEILNSFTTPVVLIPAPPAGFYIDPISVIYKINFNTVAYEDNGSIGFLDDNKIFIINLKSRSSAVYKAREDLGNSIIDGAMIFTVFNEDPTAGDSDLIIFITYQLVEL
jgi:hypothetical protein